LNSSKLSLFELGQSLVECILPIEKIIAESNLDIKDKDKLAVHHLVSYGMNLDGVSLTDLYLGLCLKNYKGIYLLTSNHKDFPIYRREHILPFQMERNIKTYALYRSA